MLKLNDYIASTRPGKIYRVTLHSKKAAKSKIPLDVKMKGPLYMEEKVEDYPISVHAKRSRDDHVTNVASTSMAPAVETPYKLKKPVDKIKIRQQVEDLGLSFVNAQGKPTCPLCERTFESVMTLLKHVDAHSDRKWYACFISHGADHVIQSGQNHNHETALVDLSKYLPNWSIVKKKRSRPIEMDEDDSAAAESLMLLANDHFSKAKQPEASKSIQMEIEAAADNLLMFPGDHRHSPMGESSVQIPTSTTGMQIIVRDSVDTVNGGGFKEVRNFDLNELPSVEEDA